MPFTILVPLDGSLFSEQALAHAVRLAQAEQARLVLAQVVTSDTARALYDAQAYLDRIAASWRGGVQEVEAHAVRGDPSAELVRLAGILPAELIVLATHGRSGVGRSIYGSVADEVVRHATTPVLLVPHGAQPPWSAEQLPKILVTLDGSESSEAILGPIQQPSAFKQAECILLQVIDSPPPTMLVYNGWYGLDTDGDLKLARAYLESVAKRLRPSVRSVTPRAELGRMPDHIVKVAREAKVNLLALATHGRGGLSRLVMGATATDLVQRADVPLLLTRPLPTTVRSGGLSAASGQVESTLSVRLGAEDLILVERGLNALRYGPHAVAARRREIEKLRERCREAAMSRVPRGASPSGEQADG
jgi:nucleotide-binding universal stress UspA family protein